MEPTLRVCVPGDETALSLVARATILETYPGLSKGPDIYYYVTHELSPEEFSSQLNRDDVRIWAVEVPPGSAMVGYALVHRLDGGSPDEWELQRLYVFFRFHGLGFGRRLMEAALTFVREQGGRTLTLRVHERNESAVAFYERYGFATIDTEASHAGDTDYRVLVLQLKC